MKSQDEVLSSYLAIKGGLSEAKSERLVKCGMSMSSSPKLRNRR